MSPEGKNTMSRKEISVRNTMAIDIDVWPLESVLVYHQTP